MMVASIIGAKYTSIEVCQQQVQPCCPIIISMPQRVLWIYTSRVAGGVQNVFLALFTVVPLNGRLLVHSFYRSFKLQLSSFVQSWHILFLQNLMVQLVHAYKPTFPQDLPIVIILVVNECSAIQCQFFRSLVCLLQASGSDVCLKTQGSSLQHRFTSWCF